MPGRSLPEVVTTAYIADTLILQSEMLRRLARSGTLNARELSELMEEMGLHYLDISHALRQLLSGVGNQRCPD
jgi:hypothetical protein